MEATWLFVFAAIGVASVVGLRRYAGRAAKQVARIPADADKLTAELDANQQWFDAYFALPQEEQDRQLDEASRRLLDGAERLLALDPVGNDRNNDATLGMIRRTKELIATGMPFSNACAKALAERDALFPPQLQSFAQRDGDQRTLQRIRDTLAAPCSPWMVCSLGGTASCRAAELRR